MNDRPIIEVCDLRKTYRVGEVDVRALQGANLALHTTYQGKDPNVNAWSPWEAVVDTGQMPQPRTWQFQINLTY